MNKKEKPKENEPLFIIYIRLNSRMVKIKYHSSQLDRKIVYIRKVNPPRIRIHILIDIP